MTFVTSLLKSFNKSSASAFPVEEETMSAASSGPCIVSLSSPGNNPEYWHD